MGHSYSVDQIHKIEYDTLVVKRGQLKPRWSSHDTVTDGAELYSTLPPKNSGRYKRRRIYASTDATLLADEMSGYMKGNQLSASADLSDPENSLPMKGNYKRRRFIDTSAEINSEHSLSPIIPHSGKVKVRRRLITTNHPDEFLKNRLVVSADFSTVGSSGVAQVERPASCNPIIEETPEELRQKGETGSLDTPYNRADVKQQESRKTHTFQLGQRRVKQRREPGEKPRDHRDSTSSYESALQAKSSETGEVLIRNRRIAINFMLGPFSIPTEASQLEYEKSTTLVVNSIRQVTANKTGEYGEIELGYCEYYEPGDYVFIRPKNDPDSVQRVAKLLGLDDKSLDQYFTVSLLNEPGSPAPDSTLRFRTPTTMRKFLTEEVDLSGPPTMEFLEELGKEVPLPSMLQICSQDRKAYWKWVSSSKPSLPDVLGDLDNLPPVEFLLQSAPLIEPRCYLASSSGEGSICICYRTEDISSKRMGLASKYLQTLEPGMRVTSAVSVGSALTLPENNSLPVVMIAEYVGIAPFRGFLDAKKLGLIRGRLYLLYEFNKSSEAAYFRTISTYAGTGVLTDVVLAPKMDKRMTPGDALAAKLDDIRWRTLLPQLVGEQNCQVFLCGSEQFCEAVRKLLARLLHLPTSDYFLKAYWLHEERVRSNLAITRVNSDFQFTSSQSTLSRGGRQSRTSEVAEHSGRAETPQDSLGGRESVKTVTYATDTENEIQPAPPTNDTIVIQQTIRVLRQETSFTSFKGGEKTVESIVYDQPKSAASTLTRAEQQQREIAHMKRETIENIKKEFGSEYDNLNEEEEKPKLEPANVVDQPPLIEQKQQKTDVILTGNTDVSTAAVPAPIAEVRTKSHRKVLSYDSPDAWIGAIPIYSPPEKPSEVAKLMTKIESKSTLPHELSEQTSPADTLTRGTLSKGKVYLTPLVWEEEVQPYSPVLTYDNPTRGLISCATMERSSRAERLKRAITSPDRSRKQTRGGFVAVTDYYTRTLELPPEDQIETVVLRNSSNWSIGRASHGRHSAASSAASSHDGDSLKGTGRWSMRDSWFRGKKKLDKRRSDVSATQPSGSVSWLNGRVSPNLHAELSYADPSKGLCELKWRIDRTESEHQMPIITINDVTKETAAPPFYARVETSQKTLTKAVSIQTEPVYENVKVKPQQQQQEQQQQHQQQQEQQQQQQQQYRYQQQETQQHHQDVHVYDLPPVESNQRVEEVKLVQSREAPQSVTEVTRLVYCSEPLTHEDPMVGLVEYPTQPPAEEALPGPAAVEPTVRTVIVHYRQIAFDDPSRGLVDTDRRTEEINRREAEYIPETFKLNQEPFGPATKIRPIFYYENLGYDEPTVGLIEEGQPQPSTSGGNHRDSAGLTLFLKKSSTPDERYEIPPPSRTLIVNQFTVSPDNPFVLAQQEKDWEVLELRKQQSPDKDEIRIPTFIPFEQPSLKRLSSVEQRRELNIQSPMKEAPPLPPRIVDVGKLAYDNPQLGLFPVPEEPEENKFLKKTEGRGRATSAKAVKDSRQRSRSAAQEEYLDEKPLEQSSSTTDLTKKGKKTTLTDKIKRAFSPVTHRKKMNREAEILTAEEPLGPVIIRFTLPYENPSKGLGPVPIAEVPLGQVAVLEEEQAEIEEEHNFTQVTEEPIVSEIEEKVTTLFAALDRPNEAAEANEFLFPYSKKDYRSSLILQYDDPMANLINQENLSNLQRGPSNPSVNTPEKKSHFFSKGDGRHTIHIFGRKNEKTPQKEPLIVKEREIKVTEARPTSLPPLIVSCEKVTLPSDQPLPITPKSVPAMTVDLKSVLIRSHSQTEAAQHHSTVEVKPTILRSNESDAAQLYELKTIATEPQPRDIPKSEIIWLTMYDNPNWGLVDNELPINVESVGPLKSFKPLEEEEEGEIIQIVAKPVYQQEYHYDEVKPPVFSETYGRREGEYDNIGAFQSAPPVATESKIILERLQQLEVSAESPTLSALNYDDPMVGLIVLDPYDYGGSLKSIIKSSPREKSQSSGVSFSETSVIVDTTSGTDTVEQLRDEESRKSRSGQKPGQSGILTKIRQSMSPPRFMKGHKKVLSESTTVDITPVPCQLNELNYEDPLVGLSPVEDDLVITCEEITTDEEKNLKKVSLQTDSPTKAEKPQWPRERSRSADELDGLDKLNEPKSAIGLSNSVEDLTKLVEESEKMRETTTTVYLTAEDKEKRKPEFMQKFKRVFSSPVFGRRSYSVERAAKKSEKNEGTAAVTPSKLPMRIESGKEVKPTSYEYVESKTEVKKTPRGKKGKKQAIEKSTVPVNVDLSLAYEEPLENCAIPVLNDWEKPAAVVPLADSLPSVMVESDHQLTPTSFAHSGVDSQIAIVQSAEVSVIIKNTITYQTSRQLNYEDPSGFVELSDKDSLEKDPIASQTANEGQPHVISSVVMTNSPLEGASTDESVFRRPTEGDLSDDRHRLHCDSDSPVVVGEESELQTFQISPAVAANIITSTPIRNAEIAAPIDVDELNRRNESPDSNDFDVDSFSYSCTQTSETHTITLGEIPLDVLKGYDVAKLKTNVDPQVASIGEEYRRLVADIPKVKSLTVTKLHSIAYENPLEGLCPLEIHENIRIPVELQQVKLTSYEDPADGLHAIAPGSPAPADPDIKEITYLSHSYMGRLVKSFRSLERNGKSRKTVDSNAEMPEDPHPSRSAELLCLPFEKLSSAGKRRLQPSSPPYGQLHHHSQMEISTGQSVSLAKRPRSYAEYQITPGQLDLTGTSDFISLDRSESEEIRQSQSHGSYDLPPARPSHSPPRAPRRISNNFDSPLTIRRKETAATKLPIFIKPISKQEAGPYSGLGTSGGGAVVLGTRHLLIGRDVEETHEVSLSLAGVNQHQPGDLIAITPLNPPDRVADLFVMYGIDDPDQMFILDMASPKRLSYFESEDGDDIYSRPVNFRTVFTRYLDLSGPPSVELLRAIDSEIGGLPAEFCAACKDTITYGDWVDRFRPDIFTVFRLLEMHQRLFPSLELLLTLLPRIKPRHYYVTSVDNGRTTFNFKTIRIDNMRLGLATNYLLYLKPKAMVTARIVPNLKLRPPPDSNTPMILMAGDLGITAIRGLWETQRKQNRPGRLVVLYEVKRPQCSLYWAELNLRKREGTVSDTLLANCESGYDLVKELQRSRKWKKEIPHMLAMGAHVYVAGSAGFCEKVRNYIAAQLSTDSMNLRHLEMYHEESGCYAEPL